MASMAGTPNLEWFLTLFERDALKQKAQAEGKDLYKYIEEEVAKVPIGARDIMYHPYLLAGGERAPFTDGNASLTKLSVTHTSMDIIEPVMKALPIFKDPT
jgi:sugar (pentulose or hexulose) kinase